MPEDRSLAGNIFKFLGLSGTGLPVDTIAPRADNVANQEKMWSDFQSNTAIANPNIWTSYNSTMQRPGSYDEMLRLWDEMTSWDLLASAVTEITDEVAQVDNRTGRAIWYECNDRMIEKSLNDMLDTVEAEDNLSSQVWYTTAFGNSFDKLQYEPGKGILGMTWVHPFDVRRYWLAKNRRCLGFRWAGNVPNRADLYTQGNHTVGRVGLGGSQTTLEDLWYPWDFMHVRRLYKHRMSEHGEPIFSEVQGIYKKLRMALDQMLVYRAQMQPDRYILNIDTQDQPPIEQMKTIQRWKTQMRSKFAFGYGGSNGGELGAPSDFKAYYDAMALDTVLWLAQPKGFQHSITKINGTANVPDVYDIELLTNLFFSAARMPKSWLGIGDTANGPVSGKSLLAQDIRFLRAAKAIRRPVISAYTHLGYLHCILRNESTDSLNIVARMSDISSLEDTLRLELLEKQMTLLERVGGVLDAFAIPKRAMVELMFKKYMHLPDDVVNAVITALPPPQANESESPRGNKPVPSTDSLVRLLEERIGRSPDLQRLTHEIQELQKHGPRRIQEPTGLALCRGHVLPPKSGNLMESAGDLDLVVSSYGEIKGLRDTILNETRTDVNETPQTGWRRWGPNEG